MSNQIYGIEVKPDANVSLSDFTTIINKGNSVGKVIGVMADDVSGKVPSGASKVSATIINSAYLDLNNFKEIAISNLPLSAVVAVTKEKGYYPLTPMEVDFNSSSVKFADTTGVTTEKAFISFVYAK